MIFKDWEDSIIPALGIAGLFYLQTELSDWKKKAAAAQAIPEQQAPDSAVRCMMKTGQAPQTDHRPEPGQF